MAHWAEHQALVVPRLRERTAQEWIDEAARWRFTFGLVQTTAELLGCPVLAERGFLGEFPTPDGTARVPLAPYLVDGQRPTELSRAADDSTPERVPATSE